MHKYDSTKFRVVPFMEYIDNDAERLTDFLKCCLFLKTMLFKTPGS